VPSPSFVDVVVEPGEEKEERRIRVESRFLLGGVAQFGLARIRSHGRVYRGGQGGVKSTDTSVEGK
jgi:hypothetical protein